MADKKTIESKLVGYTFKEPKGLDNIFDVIGTMTATLDFYWQRDAHNPYTLFMLVSKLPEAHWQAIAQCVYLPKIEGSNVEMSLATVDSSSLTIAQVLEAVSVFCVGIENLDIPDLYKHFLGDEGLTYESVAGLHSELNRMQMMAFQGNVREELNNLPLGAVLGMVFQHTGKK